jgi:hypothetical protein
VLARRIATAVLGAFVVVSVGVVVVQELRGKGGGAGEASAAAPAGDILVVNYFHGNRRCVTCNRLEAWARETIQGAFAAELGTGRIQWRTLNYEDERNAALRERYGLYSSTIVLSDMRGGEERDWRELEEIWSLQSDERGFSEYVVREARAFLEAAP